MRFAAPVATITAALAFSAAAAGGEGEATAVYDPPLITQAFSSLDAELQTLRRAFDEILAKQPNFADHRDQLAACVEASAAQAGFSPTSLAEARSGVKKMLDACAAALGVNLSGYGLGSKYGLGRLAAGIDNGPASVAGACASALGVDPRLAQSVLPLATRPPTAAEKQKYNLDSGQRMYDNAQYQAYLNKLNTDAAAKQSAAEKTEEYKTLKAAIEAGDPKAEAAARKEYEATKEALDAKKARDKLLDSKPYTPSNTSQPIRDAENQCAAIGEQVAECQRSGWLSFDCQKLKNAMDGCSTNDAPEITDPHPDAVPLPCKLGELNAEEFAQAALIACEALVNYGPDGGSPCGPGIVRDVLLYPNGLRVGTCPERVIVDEDGGNASASGGSTCILPDPCANQAATPDPNSDSCYGEIKVLTTRADATALIASVWGKLGGPAWTPTPPPPPIPGGPGPEQGENEPRP